MDPIFRILKDFEPWEDGQRLTAQRLGQHEWVLAHISRLYASIRWHQQNFGFYQYHLAFENERSKLTHLIAMTSKGQLMVCEEYDFSKLDEPKNNEDCLVALPKAIYGDFPLNQIAFAWRHWQEIARIIDEEEGIPLGRLVEGKWDENYIPPVVKIAASKNLRQRVEHLAKKMLESDKNNPDVHTLFLTVNNDPTLTALEFWLMSHRCLMRLQNQVPSEQQPEVTTLKFMPFNFGENLRELEKYWEQKPPKQATPPMQTSTTLGG
jgi:hypothetical protein